MSSQIKPRVGGNPCVAISTKQFDRATGRRVAVEVHTLRKGQSVMFAAHPGQVMELKIVFTPANTTTATKLLLEVGTDGPCAGKACPWCLRHHDAG